jgi:hypothetical protein
MARTVEGAVLSWARMRSAARFAGLVLASAVTLVGVASGEVTAAEHEIVRRSVSGGELVLVADRAGTGRLYYAPGHGHAQPIECEPLVGAWGLWIGDVDGDGQPEAIVALRKPARFDPTPENRLHVYHLIDGQCVPAWRGTRLVGRFDRLAVEGDRILVLERMGRGWQRVARYRWAGFGYKVEEELWRGRGLPDRAWLAKFDRGTRR